MKNIIKICIFLAVSLSFAQEDEIIKIQEVGHYDKVDDTYYYYKDIDGILNKFLGTWKYEDVTNNTSFEITFYFNEKREIGGDYKDGIYGKYKYIENGNLIYDTTNVSSSYRESKIRGSYFYLNNFNKMNLAYREPTDFEYHGRTARLDIEYVGCGLDLSCSPQLIWNLDYATPVLIDGTIEAWPFKIPKNMTLTKQ